MYSIFRLYSDSQNGFNSTVFDLISGNGETKQTKGLAFILSFYPDLVKHLLKLPAIGNRIKQVSESNSIPNKFSKIEVNAELLATSGKRADIVIRLDRGKIPFLVMIIEAKSISTATNIKTITKQLDTYLTQKEYPSLRIYPNRIGITLTKKRYLKQKHTSITWDDIISILSDFNTHRSRICQQYLSFLTGIEKNMNYYEEEVISVPAGETMELVEQFKVYFCPDTPYYNYPKSIYITFRKKREMKTLYRIQKEIILNPHLPSEISAINESDLESNEKERVLGYIEDQKNKFKKKYTNHKILILSPTDKIELIEPKLLATRHNQRHSSHKLSDFFNPDIREI